jgi:sirohydrochlorin cobaltochelatase
LVTASFGDATLLLIGHGSTVNRESSAPVFQHAAELRRRRLFAEVREAFWKQQPSIQIVRPSIVSPRVFIVPLFVSEGYFTEEIIPLELGLRQDGQARFSRIQKQGTQMVHYCPPIGSHPSMTSVILGRAQEVTARYPFPREPKPEETALFIAGHGTERNENSRRAIERQARLISEGGHYCEAHAVFLEESPRIGDCYGMTAARNLVMVPFFISDGLHSYEQIPVLLGEPERLVRARIQDGHPTWHNPSERKGKRVWYSRSVGTDPQLAEVILELVRESLRNG